MVFKCSIRLEPWLGALPLFIPELPGSKAGMRFAKLFGCIVKAYNPYKPPNNIILSLASVQVYSMIVA